MTRGKVIVLSFIFLLFCFVPAFSIGNNNDVRNDLKKYLDTKELEKLVESIKIGTETNIIIIDVRPKSTYLKSHIPTAINIPNGIITEDQIYLKDKDLILYCETGGRVELAKINLLKKDFDKKRMLNFGGFSRYKGTVEKS